MSHQGPRDAKSSIQFQSPSSRFGNSNGGSWLRPSSQSARARQLSTPFLPSALLSGLLQRPAFEGCHLPLLYWSRLPQLQPGLEDPISLCSLGSLLIWLAPLRTHSHRA